MTMSECFQRSSFTETETKYLKLMFTKADDKLFDRIMDRLERAMVMCAGNDPASSHPYSEWREGLSKYECILTMVLVVSFTAEEYPAEFLQIARCLREIEGGMRS